MEEKKKKTTKKTTSTKVKKSAPKKSSVKKVEKKEEVVVKTNDEKNSITNLFALIAIIAAVIVILVFFEGTVVWTITALLLMLSILIFVHELGHFIMAKKFGVHVYEFAIGMGPLVFSFRRKNDPTLYSLRALPIGGYNGIAGESYEDDDTIPKDKLMCNKPKWQRFLILVAGVVMNFITAFILLFIIGLAAGSVEQRAFIESVQDGSPAQIAGIRPGDRILKMNGHKTTTWDYITVISALKNDNEYNTYEVLHENGLIETYELVPDRYIETVDGHLYKIDDVNTVETIVDEHNLKEGEYQETKIIGIGGSTEIKKGFLPSIKYAFYRFTSIVKSMVLIIGSLITGDLSMNALSGPVGMYSIVGQAAKFGFLNLVYLTAYLSINLGVINILPFPAFDGGHILFILIELVTRRKVNQKFEAICHTIGFILIFTLMIYITFKDILRLVG